MAPIRPPKNTMSNTMTGRCTKSSSGLQVGDKIETQVPSNSRLHSRKDKPTTRREAGFIKNNVPYRSDIYRAVPAQRSSLRRALRESLALLHDAPRTSAPQPMPQRRSLRLAIIESLQTADSRHGVHVPSATHQKPRAIVPIVGPRLESWGQDIDMKNARDYTLLPSKAKGEVVPPTRHQRNSLRRALRESVYTAVQSNAYADMASDNMDGGSDIIFENTIMGPPPSPVTKSSGAISSLDLSSPASASAPLTSIHSHGSVKPLQRFQGASTASSIATHPPHPITKKPSISRLTSSISKSSSYFVSTKLRTPTTDVCRRNSVSAPADKFIANNGRLQGSLGNSCSAQARGGWYQVREIINKAPSGVYLVEWEGHDPRTGIKWPASWIEAENLSASAIREWEQRKTKSFLITASTVASTDYNI